MSDDKKKISISIDRPIFIIVIFLLLVIAFLLVSLKTSPQHSLSSFGKAPTVTLSIPTNIPIIPTDTPNPTSTSSPTSLPIPTITLDANPLVNCQMAKECGGGTRQVRENECGKSTCCQVGNNWVFANDKETCTQMQHSGAVTSGQSQNNNKVPVYISLYSITVYCKAEGVDAVKSADAANKKAQDDFNNCLKNLRVSNDECTHRCTDVNTIKSCTNLCNILYGTDSCPIPDGSGLTNVLTQFCP